MTDVVHYGSVKAIKTFTVIPKYTGFILGFVGIIGVCSNLP